MVYYNEIDRFAAAWLRELIKAGHIADGEIDERDIRDVKPNDLRGFTQCHFFAGVGVWSYALRKARWPDSRPVWTGSCPCQPFSTAGKGKGFADERHLWPSYFHLIEQWRPDTIFGEQVAKKNGKTWFDLVSDDLEGIQYSIGSVVTAASGFGAPHIRQRIYFVADTEFWSSERHGYNLDGATEETESGTQERKRVWSNAGNGGATCNGGGVADTESSKFAGSESETGWSLGQSTTCGVALGTNKWITGQAGLVNGFWGNAGWIYCRDEKYRPVEPGTFPLAHGVANRVGRLRGYGNAIVAPQAQAFIEVYMEIENSRR